MPDTDMLQILKPLLAVEHLSSSFSSVKSLQLKTLRAEKVTKLERPQRPDPWQHTCPQLYKDLSARKTVQVHSDGLFVVGGLFRTGGIDGMKP